ncbi:hypothetical protein Leryth_011674 [Lithospermum erythrorhizon]|nr:hypothetical protein Leryth_011674 [Lithospermum erythrorhizon]
MKTKILNSIKFYSNNMIRNVSFIGFIEQAKITGRESSRKASCWCYHKCHPMSTQRKHDPALVWCHWLASTGLWALSNIMALGSLIYSGVRIENTTSYPGHLRDRLELSGDVSLSMLAT